MTEFARRMLRVGKEHNLWQPQDRILVSLSGGPDSVALLHGLNELAGQEQLTLAALHMNFGLRDRQSDGDEAFCRRLCKSLQMPLHVCVPTTKCDGNLQAWARAQRLTATAQMLADHQYQWVALGHTADDRAETVILQLFRGAGPDGLGDLLPFVNGQTIRPLIAEEKRDILCYLCARCIPFRTDRSNLADRYRRNRVRHQLIPLASSIFETSATRALNQFADVSALESQHLRALARPLIDMAVTERDCVRIGIDELKGFEPAIQLRALRTMAGRQGCSPGRSRSLQLLQILESSPGHSFELGNGVIVERGRDHVWFFQNEIASDPDRPLPLSIPGVTKLPDGSRIDVVPASVATPYPDGRSDIRMALPTGTGDWSLRIVRTGDRMRPFGMRGNRLISDLLSEAGVPRFRRGQRWVLTQGDQIFWLLGVRQSEAGRVSPGSDEVYEFSWQPKSYTEGESYQ